ncbi:MAG: ankyrin repeat domain-containing protein [Armatimonadetes bacterium]|nr:ankyrin repeat domain-containing protein [Armatimonadota bacterium]
MPPIDTPQRLLRAAIKAAQAGDTAAFAAALGANHAVATHPDPLMKACSFGHVEIVRLLLDAGADPNLDTGGMGRPLDRTCCICSQTTWSPGHEATVRLLLERGADLRGRGRQGLTALGLAAWHDDWPAVALLRSAIADLARAEAVLAGAPAAALRPNARGNPPLAIVAGTRWWRRGAETEQRLATIAERLLDHGAEPDAPIHEEHDTPLSWACGAGPPAVARVFVLAGADSRSAFPRLVMRNRVELLDLIDPAHWAVDGLGDEKLGNTLLGETCRFGQLRSLAWLLAHGADPRRADNRGWTPLHYAAHRGLSDAVLSDLVAAGADVSARDAEGRTPLALAREARKTKVVAWLTALG